MIPFRVMPVEYKGVFTRLEENKGVFPNINRANALFILILGKKMKLNHIPKLTLFHCLNSFEETSPQIDGCEMKTVRMACSSMTRDIHLLKAFEAGADAVLVLVCPGKSCRHAEGGLRAKKRVDYVKTILDSIGMDGRRLNLFNTTAKDKGAITKIIRNTLLDLQTMG